MSGKISYDAVVVGAGPNGLAAAIRLAQYGLSVLMLEANSTIGGGMRSAELTLPGFIHDLCSAVHPLGIGSPFFRKLPLEKYGLKWIQPMVPLAHPFENGEVALLQRSVSRTALGLGVDREPYERLMTSMTARWETLTAEFLQPLLHWPRHPMQLAHFGLLGMRSAAALAQARFQGERARALFGGLAAHSFLALEEVFSAGFGLVLGLLAHAVGWPLAKGGSQSLANALAAHLRSLGGEIITGSPVKSLEDLPLARAVLLDVTPRQLLQIAGDKLPNSYGKKLLRYRCGPGVFKLDYALAGPIPWKAAVCGGAGTVHLGGTFQEIALAERQVAGGGIPERPFVLMAQPSLFDSTRAPSGKHTAWAYCHVPNGSLTDMTVAAENQIERVAPGFRELILARHTMTCADLERKNANLTGGDINGGAADWRQLIARPVLSPWPYRTPVPGLFLCSSSTPPGGGVHGMCGFHAAEVAIRDCFRQHRTKSG
jgi:phytoene dehydrogenase-like protein